MANAPMKVVETAEFLRTAKPLLSESERTDLVAFIGANPEAGEVIPETGGVRKVRWALSGMGKRGGARVIYYCCPRTPRAGRRTSARASGMR